MTKTCCKCKETKPTSAFYKRSTTRDGLQRQCMVCSKSNDKSYYVRNQDTLKARYKRERTTRVQSHKQRIIAASPHCMICPETDICCLDFHHVDPAQKSFTLAESYAYRTWEVIFEEIKKCVLVCKNCHAKIHTHGDQFYPVAKLHTLMLSFIGRLG
jgi:hypothetical protein